MSPRSESAKHMKRVVFVLLVMYRSLAPVSALAAETMIVTCDAEYGLTKETLHLPASSEVFTFQSVNLGDRFLFKAQLLQERAKLKTYVYELRSHSPTLIHAGEHILSQQACATVPGSLGLNKVYSSDLEREMFFQCFASCK